MWVKADFHAHCKGDPMDVDITYTPEQLLDRAASLGYTVFALTCHKKVLHTRRLAEYAAARGILLLPGAELRVQGRDVLAYNLTEREARKLTTFNKLHDWKDEDNLCIAPHPYYPDFKPHSLQHRLVEHAGLFDAVEWCHVYLPWLNPFNLRAAAVARQHGLPLVGTSDCHHLWQLNGRTHTLVDLPRNPTAEDVVRAVKAQKVKLVTRPLSHALFLRTLAWVGYGGIKWYTGPSYK